MHATGNVVRVDAKNLFELCQSFGVVAFIAAGVGELQANVDEGRAQAQRAAVLADGLIEHAARQKDVADLGVHVRNLALNVKGVHAPRPGHRCALSRAARLVDLLGFAVLPHVVVDDREVQGGIGVRGVDAQRGLEGTLGSGELTPIMVDDAEHVVAISERLILLDDLGQVFLGLRVLLLLEVAPPQGQQLLERVVHGLKVVNERE